MIQTALRVELPQTLVDMLEERGKPEKEAARILQTYHSRTDMKPMIIGDEERRAIEKMIGRNITSGEDIIKGLARLTKISVGDVQIQLSQRQMERFRILLPHKEGEEYAAGVAKIIMDSIVNHIRAR